MNYNVTIHLLGGYLAGEETVAQDNLCWVTKTHWPMESPMGSKKFAAQKCFCIVRNPIDILPSIALLINTASHSLQSQVPVNKLDPGFWDRMVHVLIPAFNENLREM